MHWVFTGLGEASLPAVLLWRRLLSKKEHKKSPYYSLMGKKMPKKQLLANRDNFWMLSVTRVVYTGCLFAGQTPTRKKIQPNKRKQPNLSFNSKEIFTYFKRFFPMNHP